MLMLVQKTDTKRLHMLQTQLHKGDHINLPFSFWIVEFSKHKSSV